MALPDGRILSKLKLEDLKEELRRRNQPKTGKKQELIDRLRACLGLPHDDEQPGPSSGSAGGQSLQVDGQPLGKLKVDELRAALETRNLPQDGKKPELVERLRRYVVEYEADQSPVDEEDGDKPVTVLMVAEKPIMGSQIARAVAGSSRIHVRKAVNGACSISEYDGQFHGRPAKFKVTSTCGHIMRAEFPDEYHNWRLHEPIELFGCPINKLECNPQLAMRKASAAIVATFLAAEAKDCDFLVLWLDCDMEGENICFEVIEAVRNSLNKTKTGNVMDRIFRAKFSSLNDIKPAMERLIKPNFKYALSVDAKKELDLRIGVAFSRFQTSFFRKRNRDRDVKLVSFGPCQTPTLAFCVAQHELVEGFQAESYWSLSCEIEVAPGKKLKLEYANGPVKDEATCQTLLEKIKKATRAKATEVSSKSHEKDRPKALNTVELLKVASSRLGLGPADAMHTAEQLYTRGYISYPRTETTAYPEGFHFEKTLRDIGSGGAVERWSEGRLKLQDILGNLQEPRKGEDKGDHPPITPVRLANNQLSDDSLRLYAYVCQHYVATLMKPCTYETSTVTFHVGGEPFQAQFRRIVDDGFTRLMTWQQVQADDFSDGLAVGKQYHVRKVSAKPKKSSPPTHMTESEVIAKMEKYGIGTDASIPGHIQNIVERNYVKVEPGRKLVPTKLGIALVRAYQRLDAELVQPEVRAQVEAKLNKIARGDADYDSVKNEILSLYKQKFTGFAQRFGEVEHFFKDCFPLRPPQQNGNAAFNKPGHGAHKHSAHKRQHSSSAKNGWQPPNKRTKH